MTIKEKRELEVMLAESGIGDETAYVNACEAQDREQAEWAARRIRDRLLKDSDKAMALDRVMPEAPSGTIFSNWLPWLRDFVNILHNNWATYRQALRDLPTQQGWPFDINWPQKPE